MEITHTIKKSDIFSLIVSALEGGSNYWYMLEGKITPTRWDFQDDPSNKTHYAGEYALNPGGALIISNDYARDEGEKKVVKRLNLKTIKQGLQLMAEKYPSHFSDILSENADASTGDVFLQLCLFGELIYG
jgi:hypothetical protein